MTAILFRGLYCFALGISENEVLALDLVKFYTCAIKDSTHLSICGFWACGVCLVWCEMCCCKCKVHTRCQILSARTKRKINILAVLGLVKGLVKIIFYLFLFFQVCWQKTFKITYLVLYFYWQHCFNRVQTLFQSKHIAEQTSLSIYPKASACFLPQFIAVALLSSLTFLPL